MFYKLASMSVQIEKYSTCPDNSASHVSLYITYYIHFCAGARGW